MNGFDVSLQKKISNTEGNTAKDDWWSGASWLWPN